MSPDATAALLTSEPAVLDSLTLTKAEAYHNMIWAMASRGVPVGAVGVQATPPLALPPLPRPCPAPAPPLPRPAPALTLPEPLPYP